LKIRFRRRPIATRHVKRPYLVGMLKSSIEARILLDTGSEVDIITRTLFDSLLMPTDKSHIFKEVLTVLNGNKMMVVDKVTLEMSLTMLDGSKQNISTTFRIAEIDEDVVLGYPTIVRYPQILNQFLQTTESVVFLESDENHRVFASLLSKEDVNELDEEDEILWKSSESYQVCDDKMFQQRIAALVEKYNDVFSENLAPGGAKVAPMPIKLSGPKPKPSRPRPVSPNLEKALRESVTELLAQGVIRESKSSYSSPVVLTKKKDGSWRFCVDYRLLNKVTVRFVFPLPNNYELLERLRGNKYFAVLDLRKGFYQFPLVDEDCEKTAFAVPWGLYEFVRMSMGLTNSPAYFQQTMMEVLNGMIGVICECFIDDLIIYANSKEELLHRVGSVLNRLHHHDIRVNMKKCRFGFEEVEYLGHIVNGEGMKISPSRVAALQQIPLPTCTKAVRSFMGLCNYMRAFIKDFATISIPLARLMSDSIPFSMNGEAVQAFNELKQLIVAAPVLRYLNYEQKIYVRTDASNVGIGGYLFQLDEFEKELPVAYVSKALNDVQRRWSTIEIECYAIYFAMSKFEQHLRGHPVIVQTDHRNLQWLYKSQVPKLIRWSIFLQEFDMEIDWIPGHSNVVADTLSRSFGGTITAANADDDEEEERKRGLEYVRTVIHTDVHGHAGVHLTVQRLRDDGYEWRGMAADVYDFIQHCTNCQKLRGSKSGTLQGELRHIHSLEPFYSIHVDTVGPLPVDEEGNRYIVVVIDSFTRYCELFACKDVTAASAARCLLSVFQRYGSPIELRSDGGGQFTADVIQQYLQLIGVAHVKTLPYRPQANGIVERANSEVIRHLKAICYDRNDFNWSKFLPLVQRVLNDTHHTSLGCSPNHLMYGGRIRLCRGLQRDPVDIDVDAAKEITVSLDDYVVQMTAAYDKIVSKSLSHLENNIASRQAKQSAIDVLTPGQLVLISHPWTKLEAQPPHKLASRWFGPRKVMAKRFNSYRLYDFATKTETWYDISRLKVFHSDSQLSDSDLAKIAAKDKNEWLVESIVKHRLVDGAEKKRKPGKKDFEFLVHWSGFGSNEDSWEPYVNVHDVEALDVYVRKHQSLYGKELKLFL